MLYYNAFLIIDKLKLLPFINSIVSYTIYGVTKFQMTAIYLISLTCLRRFKIFWGQIGVIILHGKTISFGIRLYCMDSSDYPSYRREQSGLQACKRYNMNSIRSCICCILCSNDHEEGWCLHIFCIDVLGQFLEMLRG